MANQSRTANADLQSVVMHAQDLPMMVDWYAALLDLPRLAIKPDISFHEISMQTGANLMLDDHRNVPDPRLHAQLMFKVADAQMGWETAVQRGWNIVQDLQRPHPGLDHFSIADPEGNVLMFVQ